MGFALPTKSRYALRRGAKAIRTFNPSPRGTPHRFTLKVLVWRLFGFRGLGSGGCRVRLFLRRCGNRRPRRSIHCSRLADDEIFAHFFEAFLTDATDGEQVINTFECTVRLAHL